MVFSLLHCNFSTAIMFGVITFSLLIVLTFGGLVIPNESSSDKSRILGGSTANILDFPYFAELIGPNITELRFHHCGGAILSDEVIVSAYSCLVNADAKEWTVIVGSGTSMSGGQTVKGRRIVPHFIYDPYNSENDIGLLFLDTPIDIDNITTKAIDLPEEDEEIPIGTSAVTCGYGRLSDGSYPTNLQRLSLTVTEPEVCAVDAFDRRWDVTDRMLCATNAQAGSGVDIGDNGGPLVADDVLIGITLWGGNFPHAANPGVWTRVPVFVKWIVDNMNKTIGYY